MRRGVCAALLLTLACGPHEAAAVAYATVHAHEIVTAMRPLWLKYAVGEVPESAYPPVLQPLHPAKVVAARNGVTIFVNTSYANVTGVFVRFDPSYQPPRATGPDATDPDYKPLAPDVYWWNYPR